ncbi:VOC family protein [Psychrobacillus glaciei]|uniref:VOC family protein n=2 Tax=Psychrobacillus glaciei TaxID=2283160 RepID=A0A5J6STI2_9BACI|nr:VOC family protein [Psychrobacillus glaciei]
MQIAQIRIARPTHQIKEVTKFYCEGLGLKKIGSFSGHNGYDGVMIGLPNADYHLEFTQHEDGSPCPAPTKDNLLVFYMPNLEEIELIQNRLKVMGYDTVSPENPYWEKSGITIEDPDGCRIVLMNTPGI